MSCWQCGATPDRNARFCGQCGSPLRWRCTMCDGHNHWDVMACTACGSALSTPGAQQGMQPDAQPAMSSGTQSGGTPDGRAPILQPQAGGPGTPPERRRLTVLFADMVGSTAIGARLDPEDMRDVMAAWRGCVTRVVTDHSGFVLQYMGDGALAVFGYPRAHEADAERAIRAALAIAEAIPKLETAAGPPGALRVRVGMATGLVVVADLLGPGAAQERSVVGDTMNLAARLQTAAAPGGVVVDAATRQLTGGLFEYRALGRTEVKGLDSPVDAWSVLRESAVENRFEALRPPRSTLVNRVAELAALHQAWAEASEGRGGTTLLVGEPGAGKSHLAAAFEDDIGDPGRNALRLLCSPHHRDTPLRPLIRHLEQAAGFRAGDAPEARLGKLEAMLPLGMDAEARAVLAQLLLLPVQPTAATGAAPRRLRELTFNAAVQYASALAAGAPLLVVIEDAHWADPTTEELAGRLAAAAAGLPMLLLATARPERLPAWRDQPGVQQLAVGGLNAGDAARLVGGLLGGPRLEAEVVSFIVSRADGIPLFLEELVRAVRLPGTTGSGGTRDRPGGGGLVEAEVPMSLQSLLAARLDGLGPAKRVVQAASAIGREFRPDRLQVAAGLLDRDLAPAIGELERAGIVLCGQDGVCYFRQALVQDAAYASMLRKQRRHIHLRIGEMLEREQGRPFGPAPEEIANHFARADAHARASTYYLHAAERTGGRFALAETIGLLRKGLHQVAAARDGGDGAMHEAEGTMQVALGRALIDHLGSGAPEVRAAFERARDLAAAAGAARQLLRAQDGLISHHFARSELGRVIEYAEEALANGAAAGDPAAMVLAWRSSGHARLLLGHLVEARRDLEQALRSYEAGMVVSSRDSKVSVCVALGVCLTLMGEDGLGRAASAEGLRHAESLGQLKTMTLGLRRAGAAALVRRDASDALALAGRLLALQDDFETFVGRREGEVFRAWAVLQVRHDPDAVDRARTALRELDEAGHWALLSFFMAMIAEAMLRHGDAGAGGALLRRAADLAEAGGERWCRPERLRLQARWAADAEARTALLRSSLELARQEGAALWERRAAADLIRLLRAQGRRSEAARVRAGLRRPGRGHAPKGDLPGSRRPGNRLPADHIPNARR